MYRLSMAVVACAVVAAVAVSASAEDSPWPMFRHDRKHTGRSPYTGPANPTLKWSFQARDAVVSSPSIGHNGTIYVGGGGYHLAQVDSALYALNPDDGSLKWEFFTSANDYTNGVFSSPAIGPDGTIYFGSGDMHIYAVEDSITYGKLKWRTFLGFYPVYSSPVVSEDSTVYVGSLDFTFNSINTLNGEINWRYTTGWCVFSSPTILDDGALCVGSKDHKLYVFEDSLTYGKVRWYYPAGVFYDGHLLDSSPAIGDDGTVYIGADQYGAFGQTPVPIDTAFYAVNPDGTLKWAFSVGNGVESSPGIGPDGTIYFGSYDSCLYAIEDLGTEGSLKWKFQTGGSVDASPTIDGSGIIYIGSRDSNMYAIYPDGTERWSFPTGGGIESSVTIDSDGIIYFGSFDGKVYALGTGGPDIGVESVTIPDVVKTDASYYPVAVVENYRGGQQAISVACEIKKNGSAVVFADTAEIAPVGGGTTKSVAFSQWDVDSDSGATYEITVFTMLEEDDNSFNDTVAVSVVSSSAVDYLCGDLDSSGGVDVDDIVYLIDFIFSGGPPPTPLDTGDVNCSGTADIDDVVYLANYVWAEGPVPCAECP